MRFRIISVIYFFLCLSFLGRAQDVSYYQSFDSDPERYIPTAGSAVHDSASYAAVFTYSYCKGLKGLALDLTDDVAFRRPLRVDKRSELDYSHKSSFSVQVWVQTKKGARQGTPIASNVTNISEKSAGWCIGTQDNGAWFLSLSDGKNQYIYEPTAERQAVNDGNWHQICFVVDRVRKEVWMYFDGRNVAIYNIDGLQSLTSTLHTVIGGCDDNFEWGNRGEWMSFNGRLDEVYIWSKALSSEEVQANYEAFYPKSTMDLDKDLVRNLKVQVWNIWHGGREFGKHVGVSRVIDVLKQENADVIGLIETYGSGAVIADSLHYYFYLINSNLSILSRYPIEQTIQLFRSFNSGGAIVKINSKQQIAFFDLWLHYLPDIALLGKDKSSNEQFEKEEQKTRLFEIRQILQEMEPYTRRTSQLPVIVVGDFNAASCLDLTDTTKGIYGEPVVNLPVCREMLKVGFTDTFRYLSPNIYWNPGYTWSPLINLGARKMDCLPARIDYIFSKGHILMPYRSEILQHHPKGWPSDHASVVTSFYLKTE